MNAREKLIDCCLGIARSQSLALFVELQLAPHLKTQSVEAGALAQTLGLPEEPLSRLLRALAYMQVVDETEPGHFTLGALGHPLADDAPNSVAAFVRQMNHELYQAWGNSLHTLKTGENAFEAVHGASYFEWLEQHPERAHIAHKAMDDTQREINDRVTQNYDFSKAVSVCDVGGGHGTLLATILRANPQLEGILFDLPSGLEVARTKLANVLKRCRFVDGDFFRELPDADVYLLKHVLHDWPDEDAARILDTCSKAMRPDARLLVIESARPDWPQHDQTHLWDLHMLVCTGGRERGEQEFDQLAASAGLVKTHSTRLTPAIAMLVYRKK